MGENKKVESDV